MRKIFLLLLPFLVCSIPTFGQIYVQNTQYNFSRFVYNPAVAGDAPGVRLNSVARLQWVDIEGAPNLASFSVDFPSEVLAGGVGVQILRDELGPLATTGINLAYAFHTDLKFGGKLNIGVMAGALQKSLNATWQYRGIIDPLIGPANANYSEATFIPDVSFGLMYNHYGESDYSRFYVGIAGHNLLEPSIEDLLLNPGNAPLTRVPRSFYLMGGYRIDLEQNERNYLQPTLLVRTDFDQVTRPQIDASIYWHYKVMTFGLGYRHRDSFSGIVGFELSDRLFAGYSYDFTTSALGSNGQGASHELVLTYILQTGNRAPGRITDILDGRTDKGTKE